MYWSILSPSLYLCERNISISRVNNEHADNLPKKKKIQIVEKTYTVAFLSGLNLKNEHELTNENNMKYSGVKENDRWPSVSLLILFSFANSCLMPWFFSHRFLNDLLLNIQHTEFVWLQVCWKAILDICMWFWLLI